ncbi:MAG: hypothetical protein ACLQVN_10325 [Bryobacteraceae bacterium]
MFVIGRETPVVLLAFLISSQKRWMSSEVHRREAVVIPDGTVSFLGRESFIQCWALERLDAATVRAGIEREEVEYCGSIPKRFLRRVREAVDDPYLLESGDALAARRVLDEGLER